MLSRINAPKLISRISFIAAAGLVAVALSVTPVMAEAGGNKVTHRYYFSEIYLQAEGDADFACLGRDEAKDMHRYHFSNRDNRQFCPAAKPQGASDERDLSSHRINFVAELLTDDDPASDSLPSRLGG